MLRQMRKKQINKAREKSPHHRLYMRPVFRLPDGRGAVRVNGKVYASLELACLIGDDTWVRVSKNMGWKIAGVAFDEFNRPFCDLEEI